MSARDLLAAATPRPWTAEVLGSEGYGIFGPRPYQPGMRRHRITLVGHGDWDDDKADAALIVAAVNEYEALLDVADAAEVALSLSPNEGSLCACAVCSMRMRYALARLDAVRSGT